MSSEAVWANWCCCNLRLGENGLILGLIEGHVRGASRIFLELQPDLSELFRATTCPESVILVGVTHYQVSLDDRRPSFLPGGQPPQPRERKTLTMSNYFGIGLVGTSRMIGGSMPYCRIWWIMTVHTVEYSKLQYITDTLHCISLHTHARPCMYIY